MSVPLDRLYNYLDSIIEDDIIIYRFFPHGSRKLEDLIVLDKNLRPWAETMTTPHIIFHDQEPLNFDFYGQPDLMSQIETVATTGTLYTDLVLPFLLKMHFRTRVSPWNCYDYMLLCHSEKNSSEVSKYQDNGFVGVYWWCHAIIAKDWFRFAKYDTALSPDFNLLSKDFLIYNRAWSGTREYRLTLTELLANHNLINHCKIHFSPLDSDQHYHNHIFKNPNLAITRSDLENIYPLNQSSSNASADYNNEDYLTCGIEVVLETLFDDPRQHLTEKALRPIACGRPFILTATANSLQYLRDYGFETFNGFIDETYDTIVNPRDRLIAIVDEMKRITNLDAATKNQLWRELYQIAKRNKQRFFSKSFDKFVINEFKTNLTAAMKVMNRNKTGKHWLTMRQKANAVNPAILETLNKDLPTRSLEDIRRVLEWLEINNQSGKENKFNH